MSRQVDERVVSMQFDNQRFEKNVRTSMSTLDKLKKKLDLKGASKGLDEVNSAAKRVNMTGLANGVEAVRVKFSALEVMGVTALANITNSAINAGKNIVKSLTITPVSTGFNEYELKMNATQTIMASTGESLEKVNEYLEELNKYSDKTIYSFQDMTQNIGKFTNAGVKLEDAVLAMKGISNEAALSGANANEASRAMYNFAQALSVGYVQRIDWKSIELANMATVEFKEQLLAAAIAAGTVRKSADGMYSTIENPDKAYNAAAMFTETLDDQWLTTEVLIKTLKDYADETTDIGKRATQAATEVKTFSQMMDTLKESAQSGWAKTWELIFGDYNKGKTLWTTLGNAIGGILDKMSDLRNGFLGDLMSYNPITNFVKKLETVTETVGNVSAAVKDYSNIVNQVIRGNFGNGKVRVEALTKAGWEYAEVQNRVNEKLGSSVRLATKASTAQKKQTKIVTKLTDAKLKELGLTKEEIALYRDLEKQSEKTGKSVEELVSEMEAMDGRTLLLESFKNIGDSILGLFQALKEAWSEIFPAPTVVQIYNILNGFHKLTESLILVDEKTGKLNETGEKIKRTFKGLFAIVDLIVTVISTAFKMALKAIGKVFGGLNVDVLETTASIGDMLVAFRDWVKDNDYITKAFTAVGDAIAWCITKAKELYNTIRNSPLVSKAITGISDAFNKVVGAFRNIDTSAIYDKSKSMGSDVVAGVTNGLRNGVAAVFKAIIEIGKTIVNGICKFLGIESPSKVMIAVGGFIISGLVIGLKNGGGQLLDSITGLGSKIVDAFKGLDLASVSTLFYNLFRLFPSIKILNPLSAMLNIITVCGKDVMSGLAKGISQAAPAVWETIKTVATNLIETFQKILGIKSPSRVMMAIGGFILAGLVLGLKDGAKSIGDFFKDLGANTIAFAKAFAVKVTDFIKNLDFGTVLAVAATAGLALLAKKLLDVLGTFASAAKGFSKIGSGIGNVLDAFAKRLAPKKTNFKDIAKGALQLAIAVGILAGSVYLLAHLDTKKMWWAVAAIAALAVIVGGLVVALSLLVKTENGISLGKITLVLASIALSINLMAKALATLGAMDRSSLERGYTAIVGLGMLVGALLLVIKKAGAGVAGAGKTILAISLSILLLVYVTKMVAKLEPEVMFKGLLFMGAFALFMRFLIASTKSAGPNIKGLGGTIFTISLAILAMALVARIIGGMDVKALIKGTIAMIVFALIIAGLIHIVKIGNDEQIAKVGGTILAVGIAMLLMAACVAIFKNMSVGELAKGVIVIGIFAIIVAGLIRVVKEQGSDVKGVASGILMIGVAIAILAGVTVLLGLVKIETLVKGIIAVGLLSLMMMGLIKATKGVQDCMKNLIVMTVAIAVLAVSLALLSLIEPKRLATTAGSLAAVIAAFALLIKFSGSIGDAKSMIGPMSVLLGVVAILGAIVWGLSHLPMGEDVLNKALAVSSLMVAMGAALVAADKAGKSGKSVYKGILALAAMVGPLVVFTAALAFIPALPGHVWQSLTVILPVIAAMTALMVPLALIGKLGGWNTLIGILALTAMVVPLAAFTAALAFIPQLPAHTAMTLQTLLPVMVLMTALLIPLTLIGLGMWSALIGVLALTAMVVPLMAFVAALKFMPEFPAHVPAQLKLVLEVMIMMTKLLGPLTIIGLLAPFALAGIMVLTVLGSLLLAFGTFAAIIGKLMDWIPRLQEFLDKGIPIMVQLAEGLGAMMGAFITGFSNEVMTMLPNLGQSLSDFASKATGFILMCQLVGHDDSIIKGAGTMVGAILAFSAANFIHSLTNILSLKGTLATLGADLSLFMFASKGFINGAKKIKPEVADGMRALADAVLCITAANMLDGITRFLSLGGSSLTTFGAQIGALGEGMSTFATNVSGITPEDITTAKTSAEIIKILAEASKTLPNSGGWLGAICGENDMGAWGKQLKTVAQGIVDFTNTLIDGKISSGSIQIARNAAEIITTLADAAKKIPNAGGHLATWLGDNDLSSWAEKLPTVAAGVRDFIAAVTTDANGGTVSFGQDQINIAKNAAEVISALAKAAKDVPNAGGYLAAWIGDNDLSTWAENLPTVGKGVKGFADALGTFTTEQLSTVTAATEAVAVIANMSQNYKASKDFTDFSSFGNGMNTLAEKIADFAKKMANVRKETITGAVGKVRELIGLAGEFNGVSTEAMTKFGTDLATMAKNAIDSFINAFNAENIDAKVNTAGSTLIDKLIKAVEGKQADVNQAANNVAKTAAGKIVQLGFENNKTKFADAGADLIDGLVNGLTDPYKLQEVYSAAYALGQKAVQGEKDGQQSKSPSKLTTKAGKWLGEGLIIGMKSMMSAVYNSGNNLGETATTTISSAVSRISDVVNSDMDAQPTIRPVLDLSDVRSGAAAINGMFLTNRTLSVSASGVGAISASMSRRQNGNSSADVVSAIKGLRKDIHDMPRNTYNVNGVTYDDGSNISDAVATLVRAVNIERRS